jgi:serine phosphatase RsbU (regulator of sigma subunit)
MEVNMMSLSERTPKPNPPVGSSRPPIALSTEDWITVQTLIATASDPTDTTKALAEELSALRREHELLQQAIFEAAQVQRRLCAPRELLWNDFEIAGEIFPVRHLSGDFFKAMDFGSSLSVLLGDIAGKGFTAGIWQTHQMGLLQRAAREHSNPAKVVAEVNKELCEESGSSPMTALFNASIDPQSSAITYCNAGLPAPILLRADHTLERLEVGGPMLGAVKNAAFHTGTVLLNPGDMLVAYSDGVTECRNSSDDEFEMNRLIAAAKSVFGASASKTLFSLLATVLDFAGSCSPADDITLLIIRRRDESKTDASRARLMDKGLSAPLRRTSVSRSKNSGNGGLGSK